MQRGSNPSKPYVEGTHAKTYSSFKSNGWSEIFRTKYFSVFDQLESITDESKAISQNQNFVLFSNMESEILSQFLFESSEITFDKSQKLVWAELVGRSLLERCLFILAWLKEFPMSQKLQVTTRIFRSLRIRPQKYCIYFCSRAVRNFLKGLKNY